MSFAYILFDLFAKSKKSCISNIACYYNMILEWWAKRKEAVAK